MRFTSPIPQIRDELTRPPLHVLTRARAHTHTHTYERARNRRPRHDSFVVTQEARDASHKPSNFTARQAYNHRPTAGPYREGIIIPREQIERFGRRRHARARGARYTFITTLLNYNYLRCTMTNRGKM